jgi:hypothetical protein
LNLRPLGYEPYDVHLCRLVRSPVAAMTLALRLAHVCVKISASPPSHRSRARLVHKSDSRPGLASSIASGDGREPRLH